MAMEGLGNRTPNSNNSVSILFTLIKALVLIPVTIQFDFSYFCSFNPIWSEGGQFDHKTKYC